jgi:hypothetical protein
VSPQSRRRSQPPAGDGGSARSASSASPGPPNALFRELLVAARELLAIRSPLDAEMMVSELLGTWWGQRHRSAGGAGIEQLLGEGLVTYAAGQRSPAALALLSGIACLGTPRQALLAEQAAIEMIDGGVRAPGWASHLGAVTPAECYVNPDRFGDQDEIICVFSYAGEEPHALVMVVDYNSGAMIRDGWVTSRVDKLLSHCRQASAGPGATAGPGAAGPGATAGPGADQDGDAGFRAIDPPQARQLLEAALSVTDDAMDPPVSESFPSYHAFIRARIRALPPSRGRGSRGSSGTGAYAVLPAAGRGPAPVGGRGRKRQQWSRDRRAMLAAEFLASDEAEDLSDRSSASHCADRIIDYGCEKDFGRPLRMSPVKVQNFMLGWLPRKVMLSKAEQDAMPHVLAAWVRWAGRKLGLAEDAVGETLDAVFESMGAFARAYRDPAEFGLDETLVARLLPDSDLEALPRRAFAFPVLQGMHGGVDLSRLDPADPADRRMLLAADHDTRTGSPNSIGVGHHIDMHLKLADRLWRGDPPVLWEAAQRLLDTGEDRHLVLHALMEVLEASGEDSDTFEGALRDLATGELRGPEAAAARGLHDEDIARADLDTVAAVQRRDLAVRPLDPVPAERAGLAARHAERRHPPVPGQHRDRHRLEEPDPPLAAVPARPPARAAAARQDRV